MHEVKNREGQAGADTRPEELRRLAAALRARLSFHQQCGISAYPFIAEPQLLSQTVQPKERATAVRKTAPSPNAGQGKTKAPAARTLVKVRKAVVACNRCPLAEHSPGPVAGVGPAQAAFMVVGDYAVSNGRQAAQGSADAQTALCFGTHEDELFWKMMQAIQLGPQDVYVTNALKCQPVQGQEPDAAWLRQCQMHLVDEINSVRPHLICAMGEVAAAALLGGRQPVARLRGRIHSLQAGGEAMTHYKVMVTYHPRFLLQVTDMKGAAWQDLQQMRDLFKQHGKARP